VYVTLPGLKLGWDTTGDGKADIYQVNPITTHDYYAFGMEIGSRSYSASGYRYGFNGKEKNTEWEDNYDYGERIYDGRLGKFLSVDPLTKSFPWYTPYQFAGNKPIVAIDLDGAEEQMYHHMMLGQIRGTAKSGQTFDKAVENQTQMAKHGALGEAGGALIVADVYLTRGRISTGLAMSDVINGMDTKDPAKRQAAGYAATGVLGGYLLGYTLEEAYKLTQLKVKVTTPQQLQNTESEVGKFVKIESQNNLRNPSSINFSQRTVSDNVEQYVSDMKDGNWDWGKSGPIRVMEMDGQMVSYDNRRLMAAQQAELKNIPVQEVNPNEIMPGSNKTWAEAFKKRFNDPRNSAAGGTVPNGGLKTQPKIVKK
jgi:RHS repeat-associated protein